MQRVSVLGKNVDYLLIAKPVFFAINHLRIRRDYGLLFDSCSGCLVVLFEDCDFCSRFLRLKNVKQEDHV